MALDATFKQYTLSCNKCPHYLLVKYKTLIGEIREEDICNYGLAFRLLSPPPALRKGETFRKCSFANKQSQNPERTAQEIVDILLEIEREFMRSMDRGDNF